MDKTLQMQLVLCVLWLWTSALQRGTKSEILSFNSDHSSSECSCVHGGLHLHTHRESWYCWQQPPVVSWGTSVPQVLGDNIHLSGSRFGTAAGVAVQCIPACICCSTCGVCIPDHLLWAGLLRGRERNSICSLFCSKLFIRSVCAYIQMPRLGNEYSVLYNYLLTGKKRSGQFFLAKLRLSSYGDTIRLPC